MLLWICYSDIFNLYLKISYKFELSFIGLVNTESAALSYLCHNPMDALIAVNLPNNEFLLVFSCK